MTVSSEHGRAPDEKYLSRGLLQQLEGGEEEPDDCDRLPQASHRGALAHSRNDSGARTIHT